MLGDCAGDWTRALPAVRVSLMATIRLTTKFFPLAFLLFFSPAHVEIDGGEAQKVGWGTTELSVTPGTHRLRVFFVYLWILGQRGNAESR
jgi:hypothetical protein